MTSDPDVQLDFDLPPAAQWRLAQVQVANWGTFHDEIHTLPIARRGHLITGPSGSGKSSLLDAIAAVLTPDKWLRLNQAAQGAGPRSDQRSIHSYVRGAWSRDVDEHEDRVVSTYLRPRATWSGIVLRFEDGAGRVVSACRLFFVRAGGSSTGDVNDLCLLERSAVDLQDLQRFAASGLETRQVQHAWPDAVVTSNRTHGRFYARLRSLFEIRDESALQLLHKTQSAKNLDSLDQLFRDYMLETPETFRIAGTAVEQFGELRDAHDRVVQLRRQRDHLLVLREDVERYDGAQTLAATKQRLIDSVADYQQRVGLDLARSEQEAVVETLDRLVIELGAAQRALDEADEAVSRAERVMLDLGGAETQHLQQRIRDAGERADDVRLRWEKFDADLRRTGVDGAPDDAGGFAELMRAIDQTLAEPVPAGADHESQRLLAEARRSVENLDREITSIRRSGSTVPAALLEIRDGVADSLGLPPSALPFAAELIEVAPDHARWAGAIERVLRPLALTLLVRSEYLGAVRRWVDGRTLRGRLVFEEVVPEPAPPRPARSALSLVNRIRVAAGPFAAWVNGRLSERYDYACVETADDLDAHLRAVTVNGQVKSSATRYEKDDRRRLDDRSQWVLGDREAKLESLVEGLRQASAEAERLDGVVDRVQRARDVAVRRRAIFESVRTQRWDDVDRGSADAAVRDLERQLSELTRGNTRLDDAVRAAEGARKARADAQDVHRSTEVAVELATRTRAEIEEYLADATARIDADAEQAPAEVVDELAARFRAQRRRLTRQGLGEVGQQVTQKLSGELVRARDLTEAAASAVVSSATSFNQTWRGAAANAELVPTLEGRHGYLDLLAEIQAQGLPEHEATFLRLLRERSRDLIGELVSDILAAPREIQERVEPVNRSLGRSPFDEGRFLRLRVKTRRTQTVTRFIADLREISEGSWTDDDLESAERRFTTLAGLMRRLGSSEHADRVWRQQCLDTRHHVTFLAEEVDKHDRVRATYDSGAAMSGGQQQKLVVFCLAAALRYQLADPDATHPAYGVVILDEAFDKADTRYTRMALDIFVEFGFQMVLATPQKLLQTIEPYVGAATSIENPTRKRSVTAEVTWEDRRRGSAS